MEEWKTFLCEKNRGNNDINFPYIYGEPITSNGGVITVLHDIQKHINVFTCSNSFQVDHICGPLNEFTFYCRCCRESKLNRTDKRMRLNSVEVSAVNEDSDKNEHNSSIIEDDCVFKRKSKLLETPDDENLCPDGWKMKVVQVHESISLQCDEKNITFVPGFYITRFSLSPHNHPCVNISTASTCSPLNMCDTKNSSVTSATLQDFHITRATVDDAAFISVGTLMAERTHTGIGMWDVLFGSDESLTLRSLAEVISTDELSHVYYKHFFVLKCNVSLLTVACCSCYLYPTVSLEQTMSSLQKAAFKLGNWSPEYFEQNRLKLDFLRTSFPDAPYDGSSIVETVYTHELYRKRGLSSLLINKCIDESKLLLAPRCMIIVATGHDSAKRIYSKLGFVQVAQLYSEECLKLLKSTGFDIMVLPLVVIMDSTAIEL